uniref:G_PROTEIN_RECEP_F1_2 domain-containing protein n=1 Tax=Heterorhabditis bacteriophora TaxID=37862 RepID=A0A1I7X4W5_HETBA
MWALKDEDPNEYSISCTSMTHSVQAGITYVYRIIFVLDLVSLISFIVLYQYNIKKSSISFKLSNKFQRCENVEVLRSLVPLIVTNGILDVITITMGISSKLFRKNLSFRQIKIAENMAYMIHPQYCLVMVILLVFALKRHRIRRKIKLNTIVKKSTPKEREDMYFKSYAKQW